MNKQFKMITKSFATVAPPEPYKLRAKAEDRNGTAIDIEFQEASIPLMQKASTFAFEQIKAYVPFAERKQFKPSKDDPEPTTFPQGPFTGVIELTEQSCMETANMYFQQVPFGEIPWTEFVFMRQTAPKCYFACQKALFALSQEEDLEGNSLAASGLDLSARRSENPSETIPSSSPDETPLPEGLTTV